MNRRSFFGAAALTAAAAALASRADRSVKAVTPIRGGWGSSRLLPYLEYDVIRRNPKIVLCYSDITALLIAIHARTGLSTFHGPNGMGRWDEFSVNWVRHIHFDREA